jgi:hypothetical protein
MSFSVCVAAYTSSCTYACLSVLLEACLSVHLHTCLSMYAACLSLNICLVVCLFIHPYTFVCLCLSIFPCVFLFIIYNLKHWLLACVANTNRYLAKLVYLFVLTAPIRRNKLFSMAMNSTCRQDTSLLMVLPLRICTPKL